MQITTTQPASTIDGAQRSSFDSTDFNTFLTMLTTQLKHQDPLNPVDSTDYAVQLATFSNVEQAVKTNDLLSKMNEQLSMSGISQIAAWVGLEALHSGPVAYKGQEVSIMPNYSTGANGAVLVVKDRNGNLLSRNDISLGLNQLNWQGLDASGNKLADGNYSLLVESYYNDTLIGTLPVSHYGRIDEVQRNGGANQVLLSGGTLLDASAIKALRQPR